MTVSKTLEEEEYKILTRLLLITSPTASPYLYIPRFLMEAGGGWWGEWGEHSLPSVG